MNKIIAPLFILVFAFCSCSKSSTTQDSIPCDPAISYAGKVKPIFVANCISSGCHDGISNPSLADYTTARDAATQIRDAVNRGIMPKNSTLSATDKAAIICWIDNGTKNN